MEGAARLDDFEGFAEEGFGIGLREVLLSFADGGGGFGLFVAEGDEGEDGVGAGLIGWRALGGCGGLPGGGDADFVAEFDDDAFGGFFADAFDFADEGGVGLDDGGAKSVGGEGAEDLDGGAWADAGDVVDEEAEEVAFFSGGESVEDVGIFANDEVGEEGAGLVRGGEFIVGGHGDEDFVADALDVEDGVGGEGVEEEAAELSDHGWG